MPLSLIGLLQADGKAAIVGQTFDQVTGTVPGVKMSDYRVTAMTFSGSEPVNDNGPYANNTSFAVTATFTRGGLASLIQRNLSSDWWITARQGDPFTATVTSFTSNGAGSSHDLTFQVNVPPTGSKSVNPSVIHSGTQPSGTSPWPVQWSANISPGSAGTAYLNIEARYTPDAYFNPMLRNLNQFDVPIWNNIPVTRGQFTSADYEIEWHYGAGMARANWYDAYDEDVPPNWNAGSRLSTGTTFGTTVGITNRLLVYPQTDPEVGLGTRNTPVAGLAVIWMRWRPSAQDEWQYPIQPGFSAYPGRWMKYDPRTAQ